MKTYGMNFSSLYVHIPFCLKICDYCAFYIIDKANSTVRRRYLERLREELRLDRHLCAPMKTIYLGGGTPTFLSVSELRALMAIFSECVERADDCEFTIECNPDSLTREKVKVLLEGGVNRFSLGVQSFSQATRDTIGRSGDISRIYHAVETLRSLNVDNFNCDLIYGVPGQTLRQWEQDLRNIVKLHPPHISTYALTIEENTPLAIRGVKELRDDLIASMWEFTNEYLEDECRLHRYEISNLAKSGFECQHNWGIWMGAAFVGAGPSACYFDGRSRWTNPVSLDKWLRGESPAEDYLPPHRRALEILITGLRTVNGWDRNRFTALTGYDFFDLRGDEFQEFIQSGHMRYGNNTLQLTDKGLLVADYIGRELLWP